jgi:hypothetical protein
MKIWHMVLGVAALSAAVATTLALGEHEASTDTAGDPEQAAIEAEPAARDGAPEAVSPAKPEPVAERAAVAPTPPAAAPEAADPSVSLPALEAYFADAAANPAAERKTRAFIDGRRQELGLSFEHDSQCRGRICKVLFRTASMNDAGRLREIQRADVDIFYGARIFDFGKVEVTVYTSERGSTLGEILRDQG